MDRREIALKAHKDWEGKIEVVCHFCPEKYTYYKEDIDKLLGR